MSDNNVLPICGSNKAILFCITTLVDYTEDLMMKDRTVKPVSIKSMQLQFP